MFVAEGVIQKLVDEFFYEPLYMKFTIMLLLFRGFQFH